MVDGRRRRLREIRGGRPRVRAKLYMAAFDSKRHNSVIGALHARLVTRGKTFKQAMTTCMRKLLVLTNMLAARRQVWCLSRAA